MTAGIYSITNTVTGERYVGSSVNIEARWVQHRVGLLTGDHHSKKLRGGWFGYGDANFNWEILWRAQSRPRAIELELREFEFIEKMKSNTLGYNMTDDVRRDGGLAPLLVEKLIGELLGRFSATETHTPGSVGVVPPRAYAEASVDKGIADACHWSAGPPAAQESVGMKVAVSATPIVILSLLIGTIFLLFYAPLIVFLIGTILWLIKWYFDEQRSARTREERAQFRLAWDEAMKATTREFRSHLIAEYQVEDALAERFIRRLIELEDDNLKSLMRTKGFSRLL